MTMLRATLTDVTPGQVVITLPFRADLTQQHGYLHAGIVTTIADSACGYAALSLMSSDSNVLSVEFKINLLAPARGTHFVAYGRVTRPGRTLTVCSGDVFALDASRETPVATMLATMIRVPAEQT